MLGFFLMLSHDNSALLFPLPKAKTTDEYQALLPQQVDRDNVKYISHI
jgi:hypothetical protein